MPSSCFPASAPCVDFILQLPVHRHPILSRSFYGCPMQRVLGPWTWLFEWVLAQNVRCVLAQHLKNPALASWELVAPQPPSSHAKWHHLHGIQHSGFLIYNLSLSYTAEGNYHTQGSKVEACANVLQTPSTREHPIQRGYVNPAKQYEGGIKNASLHLQLSRLQER